VSATLQAMMMLYDQKKIDLNQRLAYYLPETDSTNKADMTIRQLLLHEAGLKSFIPFWTYTRNSYGQLNPDMFSVNPSNGLKVADNMYVKPAIKDSVFKWIMASPVSEVKRHVYSDLGMILLQRVIEKVAGMPLDKYCQKNLFNPLQLNNTGFNIYETKNLSVVAPTENERDFRNRSIHGTVHDPNAALLGGVAGHAGLFSNAWDLAKILQMNLNGGTYENHNYVSPATVDFFTSHQSNLSQRALGWNKPKHDDSGNVSEFASDQAYGHTGYTGTVVWVDPKYDLVFVFLSNRVYPQISNKLIKNKTRKRVHDLVYQAMF
jgi:beta-N-acetylhexosaminidase